MRGFSKAIIAGNLTRDPETRATTTGTTVCSFSVAVNRTYRDSNGGQREEVSFIDCTAWGRIGETIAQYAKKGNGVLVSGRLNQRSYENKDGVRRYRTEIVVEDFNFLGGGRSDGDNNTFTPSGATGPAPAPAPAGDVTLPPGVDPEEGVNLEEIPF